MATRPAEEDDSRKTSVACVYETRYCSAEEDGEAIQVKNWDQARKDNSGRGRIENYVVQERNREEKDEGNKHTVRSHSRQ